MQHICDITVDDICWFVIIISHIIHIINIPFNSVIIIFFFNIIIITSSIMIIKKKEIIIIIYFSRHKSFF